MIRIDTLPVTSLQQNCRVLSAEGEDGCVVVDPGGDSDQILSFLRSRNLKVQEIWLTHSHLDHCGGVKGLLDVFQCPLLAHPAEREMRSMVEQIARMYAIPDGSMQNCPEPQRLISGGETLDFAGVSFQVRFTPGHSPGHVIFVCPDEGFVLAGDTVFRGSIGRTDLPGGDHGQLLRSIQNEIFTLPDETVLYTGHGPETRVGVEKKTNPFLTGLSV